MVTKTNYVLQVIAKEKFKVRISSRVYKIKVEKINTRNFHLKKQDNEANTEENGKGIMKTSKHKGYTKQPRTEKASEAERRPSEKINAIGRLLIE